MERKVFTIGEELLHVAGDASCPQCLEGYPEGCPCGGLMHAEQGDTDAEGTDWPATRCDACGRSKDDLD
jgi:hypothetical protein